MPPGSERGGVASGRSKPSRAGAEGSRVLSEGTLHIVPPEPPQIEDREILVGKLQENAKTPQRERPRWSPSTRSRHGNRPTIRDGPDLAGE